jgi:hypothetical protein
MLKYNPEFKSKARTLCSNMGTEGRMHDLWRGEFLARLGMRVLRFDILQCLKETDAVVEVIHRAVREFRAGDDKSPLSPLFQRGGQGRT